MKFTEEEAVAMARECGITVYTDDRLSPVSATQEELTALANKIAERATAELEAKVAELEKDAARYRAHRASTMREYECSKGFWWRAIGTDTAKFDAAYDLDFPELKDAAIEAQKGRTK